MLLSSIALFGLLNLLRLPILLRLLSLIVPPMMLSLFSLRMLQRPLEVRTLFGCLNLSTLVSVCTWIVLGRFA